MSNINFLLKRSSVSSKRPTAAQLDIGELSLNYEQNTAGVFFEDSNGDVRKVGPVEVSASAPNSSPAGSSGNSLGELWYDTGTSNLKIWTGASFVSATSSVAAGGSDTQVQFNSTGSLSGSVNLTFDGTNLTCGGDITIADKIIHGGDTNTAIRFPANDTISFEVNGNAAAAYISSSANFGINTIPAVRLHVKTDAGNNTILGETAAGASYFRLRANNQTNASYNGIYSEYGTTNDWFIEGGQGTGNILRLGTNNTPRAIINGSGHLYPAVDSTYDLGLTGTRWRAVYADDVYTGDLHMKNERGDYTLIEEEDALTIRNNKTGKVYNIVMTEREV